MLKRNFGRFLRWRIKNINEKNFVIILSAIIGVAAGIAAYMLKTFVFYIQDFLTGDFVLGYGSVLYVIYPFIGVLLTILFLKYVVRDTVRHGIPRILYVISKRKSKMKRHKFFSSLVGGALTAGFGGSIGLEAPIISSGSSIGSSLGQLMRLNYKQTTLLIGCGAAGAMASIFVTPIAAVIFSLEVLMLDLTISSIIPLLIASVAGAITTKFLMAEQILINYSPTEFFTVGDVPFFILLGIICGLVSLYFNRMNYVIREQMDKVKNVYIKAIVGVFALGVLLYIFPPLYGEGYDSIKLILNGKSAELLSNGLFSSFRDHVWMFLLFILFLVMFKVVATTLTIESGGVGGIFAPSAVMGGLIGFAFARLINTLGLTKSLAESNYTLIGMAGVLGGVLHAPLTAIFLIAEITNGYDLIVPLMLTTTISFLTVKFVEPHSVFTRQLARKGELITHHKDQAVLTLLKVKHCIDKDFITIPVDATIGDLVKAIPRTKRNLFPIVDEKNHFKGLVALEERTREDIFKPEKYKDSIKPYVIQPSEIIGTSESMEIVMEKFKKSGYYNLPVIDHGKYIGFVSRSNIFSAYRKQLLDVSHD